MSLVGPRPEIPEVIYLYGDNTAKYLSVKPGITCTSKATLRDALTKEETLKLDLDYTAGAVTNGYYIWAEESTLPTPSGEKYFIKSNIPWPTLLSSTLTNTGAVTFQSTLSVTGTTTLSSNATVGGTLTVTGNATFNSNVDLQDNDYLYLGTGDDLSLVHDGTDSKIENDTGDLYITNTANDKDIIFQSDDASGGVTTYLSLDGGQAAPRAEFFVDVYFKSGADSHPDAFFIDQGILQFGGHGDLQIQHDGTDSSIVNIGNGVNGDLVIEQQEDNKDIIIKNDNGSGGTTAYITLDGDAVSTAISTIKVLMPNLPTSDPSVAGQLWNSSGDLKISAG